MYHAAARRAASLALARTACRQHRGICAPADPPAAAAAAAAVAATAEKRPRKSTAAGARKKTVQPLPAPPAGVFVSKHFRLARGEVETYLERHSLRFRNTGTHAVIETCPFCHDTKGALDNQHKMYVDLSSGVYFCHRCAAKGSWFTLRTRVGGGGLVGSLASARPAQRPAPKRARSVAPLQPRAVNPESDTADGAAAAAAARPRPSPRRWATVQENLTAKFPTARQHLNEVRGIRTEVLQKYGVGVDVYSFARGSGGGSEKHVSFAFPMFDGDRKLVRFKVRAVEHKAHMMLDPKGGEWGMFGLDTVPADAEEIVVTEGEFDAMAVYQATGRPAVSLPNGARSLPVSLLPALERFKKVYLWMDDDVPGREGAQHFARKLGMQRCALVRSGTRSAPCKDANDALLQNLDLSAMLGKATAVPHEGVATFADLREEIFTEFTNPLQVQGVQSEFLPRLNSLMKGHRRGELSIVSGHTGVGKTTLLAQMSLDYCMQGVPTLWGSFEISNVRIAKLLLSQFYARSTGKSPVGVVQDFDEWAEKFEALPLFFMRYFGSNPIERVLDAMEYSTYVHDCSHVLLDNLQFMTSGQGRGYDRFEVMDSAVEKLRRFSTAHNAHVSLVVHPRKENDDQAIQTASIFGTGKATQEADNLIILQRTASGPVLDVRKNRFDGTLGTLNLRFNQSSRMFEERDAPRRETRTLAAVNQSASMRRPSGVAGGGRSEFMGVKRRRVL
jgi:twinkle protein